MFSEKNVPIFGPPLPCPPVFRNHQEFRDFLLVKCKWIILHSEPFSISSSLTSSSCFCFLRLVMNGEKAAYGSPTFSNRRQRTLDSLITRLLQDHMHEVTTCPVLGPSTFEKWKLRVSVLFRLQKLGARKSWNEALDSSRGNRRKGMEREQAFLQLGQVTSCKLTTTTTIPSSRARVYRKQGVQPQATRFSQTVLDFCGVYNDCWLEKGILVVEDKDSFVHQPSLSLLVLPTLPSIP